MGILLTPGRDVGILRHGMLNCGIIRQWPERREPAIGCWNQCASKKEHCCAPEAPSRWILESEVSGEIERSAELLLGSRERVGKQVLFVL